MTRLIVRLGAVLAGVGLGLAACAERTPPAAEPPGALLVARGTDLRRLLARLEALEGTPLARRAREIAAGLPACPELEAHAPSGDAIELLGALRCRPAHSALEALHRERGIASLAFVWPVEASLRLRGLLRLRDGGDVDLELRAPARVARGARALVLPGADPAGPGLLSGAEHLLHARVRPGGGLDLSALVPGGSQADQLFRLRSDLFTGVVLDGTWEAAVYLPEEGAVMPPAALAVGFRHRGPAVAAMEDFLDELRRTWPVRRSFFEVGDAEGACLLDLQILPAFAPCYVATDRALVVGWNPESLRKALDGAPAPGPGAAAELAERGAPAQVAELGAPAQLVVELGRIAEANARMARARGSAPASPAAPPWRRLRAAGERRGEALHLQVTLEAETGA
jgi:hypothetical protein